jgi:hypothetical protein
MRSNEIPFRSQSPSLISYQLVNQDEIECTPVESSTRSLPLTVLYHLLSHLLEEAFTSFEPNERSATY